MKDNAKKKGIIIAAIIAIIAIIGIACVLIFTKKPDSKKEPAKTSEKTTTTENNQEVTEDAVEATGASAQIQTATKDIADAPEPTLSSGAMNTTILDTDPAPEAELKQNQQNFNTCMEQGDYNGAKEVLESYYDSSYFALADISGKGTFDNYVYFYEKQGMYNESAMYQLDFLEQHMGLDNIIEENIRYQSLLKTLQYVSIEDPRLELITASVNRWNEIESLLAENKVDTALTKLKGYVEGGMDCAYLYHYIAEAYRAKQDYYLQAKTYYIILLKLQEREPNVLETSFEPVFIEHVNALYDMFLISDEERNLIEDTVSADSLPW